MKTGIGLLIEESRRRTIATQSRRDVEFSSEIMKVDIQNVLDRLSSGRVTSSSSSLSSAQSQHESVGNDISGPPTAVTSPEPDNISGPMQAVTPRKRPFTNPQPVMTGTKRRRQSTSPLSDVGSVFSIPISYDDETIAVRNDDRPRRSCVRAVPNFDDLYDVSPEPTK
jgi:hypothetical protein